MKQAGPEIKQHYRSLALITFGFLALCGIFQATQGTEWASLHTTSILNGQIWRFITGHMIHLDWNHYAMNMVGLSLCVVVYKNDLKASHWVYSFIVLSLISSTFMMFWYTDEYRYMGFSDVLHGWILIGAMAIMHKEPKLGWAVFILFWMKIIEENLELTFFTSYGVSGTVAKESHIFGAIGGIFYALAFVKESRSYFLNYFVNNKLLNKA